MGDLEAVVAAVPDEVLAERRGKLAVVDNGTQYGGLYATKFKRMGFEVDLIEAGVYKENEGYVRPRVGLEDVIGYAGVVVAGGKSGVTGPEEQRPDIDPRIYTELDAPLLGTCFGMQDVVDRLDGRVQPGLSQCGPVLTKVDRRIKFFRGLEMKQQVNATHGDGIARLPPHYRPAATSINALTGQKFIDAAYRSSTPGKKNARILTMFHPETFLTTNGQQMLRNFVEGMCGLTPRAESLNQSHEAVKLDEMYQSVRESVRDRHVFFPISGGIDSTVTYETLRRAGIPEEQIHPFHIDTGFGRLLHGKDGPVPEGEEVVRQYHAMGWNVELLDRRKFFADFSLPEEALPEKMQDRGLGGMKLKNAYYSEHKRLLFQTAYNQILLDQMEGLSLTFENSVAAQGTNQADKVESGRGGKGGRGSAVIKTHHNVGSVFDEYEKKGLLVEPLHEIFKSDIYKLGELFGLPKFFSTRKPFPGPGLLVRHPNHDVVASGLYSQQDMEELDHIANQYAGKYGVSVRPLPLEMVGTAGDERVEGITAILQHPERIDRSIGTLRHVAGQLPHYTTLSRRKAITRFITPILPISIPEQPELLELQNAGMSIQLLQRFDYRMNRLVDQLQVPMTQVVAYVLPFSPENNGRLSYVFRPWLSPDLMSGIPLIPGDRGKDDRLYSKDVLSNLMRFAVRNVEFTNLFYDLSHKPIAGTEPM